MALAFVGRRYEEMLLAYVGCRFDIIDEYGKTWRLL
jgi:hypothetical protein